MDIASLLYRGIRGKLSEEEQAQLDAWIAESPEHLELAKRLFDPEWLTEEYGRRRSIDASRPKADMKRQIAEKKRKHRNIILLRSTAVAAVVGLFGIFAWNHFNTEQPQPEAPMIAKIMTIDDIKPGQAQATLTSESGESIDLGGNDTVNNNAFTQFLAQNAAAEKSYENRIQHLNLSVPRGGEFKIMLEDSTVVWLNSDSKLVYPEHFTASERRVKVSGEAYFEVHKEPGRPFFVESEGQVIHVYGTTFNVKAYAEDASTYTTLETGSISLGKADGEGGEITLTPGHQAIFDHVANKVEMKVVRPETITGWRHGRFVFEEQPLKIIMRDLSRWYDFEYEFTDPSLENIVFMGSIPRYADFATAAAILENSGDMKFEISDNKVVVTLP